MKKFGILVILCSIFASPLAFAGGYTNWATPTSVQLVDGGLLIAGAFGDPNACGKSDYVFVPGTNNDYKESVSLAFSALTAGRQMRIYITACTTVSFHWSGNVVDESLDGPDIDMK